MSFSTDKNDQDQLNKIIISYKTKSLKEALNSIDNFNATYCGDIFNEFTISFPSSDLLMKSFEILKSKNIILGISASGPTKRWDIKMKDGILI